MVLSVAAIIVLVLLYPMVCHILFLPNLFAILVGIAVGATIRTSGLLGRSCEEDAVLLVLLVVGVATLAAIGVAHLLPYFYMQSERSETLWSLGSFLSWVDRDVYEVWDRDSDSFLVFRGFGALLFGIFLECGLCFIAAIFTVTTAPGFQRSTAQNSSGTEPNKHKPL
jgi:hypothetical protein